MSKSIEINLVRIVQYEYRSIKVLVKIDRMKKTASIVEYDRNSNTYKDKAWKFTNRGTEYMNGWLVIIDAMREAITAAKEELDDFADEDINEIVKMHIALNEYNDKSRDK
jgi:hypothetical protein